MSNVRTVPDYDLADTVEVTTLPQLRALVDPLRTAILDLVLERAATVADLASAVGRPKSTVAHHVDVLVKAGLLRVVRTRRVRALEERSYGRRGRTITVGVFRRPGDTTTPVCVNGLAVAAAESVPAHQADRLYTTVKYARIPPQRASEFWRRVEALVREFTELPRSGDTAYGFVAGLYPTDRPMLPEAHAGSAGHEAVPADASRVPVARGGPHHRPGRPGPGA